MGGEKPDVQESLKMGTFEGQFFPISLRVFVFVLLGAGRGKSACPDGCDCDLASTTVNCSGLGFTGIPDDIPGNVTTLILSHNLIEVIGADAFSSYPSLLDLDLEHNLIHTIEPGAFDGTPAIVNLDLSNNKLSELQHGSLRMPSVTKINLARNQLEHIAPGAFQDCWYITQVFLEDNLLSVSVFTVLKTDLLAAQHLDLSRNPLKTIPYSALNRMPLLNLLVLTNSQIESIDSNAFLGLDALTHLFMADNNIQDLRREFFQPLQHVSDVDISGNPILCQCPVKQFQDWLGESNVGLITPTTCHDVKSGENLDIENDDLEYMCWSNFTSPWPPCIPVNSTDCSDAMVEIDLEGEGGEIRVIWQLFAIDTDHSVAMLGCRRNQEENIVSSELHETSGNIILLGVGTGDDVSCCIFVPACTIHACADHMAPPAEDADVALIVVSSVLVIIVLVVIVLVIYWLVWGRNSIYASAEDLPRETSKPNSCEFSNSSNHPPNNSMTKSSTIRSLGYRLSDSDGQYEVIDPKTFRTNSQRSFDNHAFENHESHAVGSDDEVFTLANQRHLPNDYLQPLPDLPQKKHPKRFTKGISVGYTNGGTWPRNSAPQHRPQIETHFPNDNSPINISNPSYKTKDFKENDTVGDEIQLSSQYLHFN